eukprot:gene10713-22367_t
MHRIILYFFLVEAKLSVLNGVTDQITGSGSHGRLSKKESWISQFCESTGHNFFIEVPISFIQDPVVRSSFNDYIDLPFAREALKLITTDNYTSSNIVSSSTYNDINDDQLQCVAKEFYGFFHAQYLATLEGLNALKIKHERGDFGKCPRLLCGDTHLLPVGLHDKSRQSSVKCFCPSCRDVYNPRHGVIAVDGAAFGTSLPHIFLQQFPHHSPPRSKEVYDPKIHGFRIHREATELRRNRGELQ